MGGRVAVVVCDEVLRLLGAVVLAASSHESTGRRGARSAACRQRALAEGAKEVLAATPGASHRIERVAAALGVSPSHLAHVFREQTGVSLHRYLLHVRMATAVGRVWDGEASLSTLALDLGFSSHSHFTSAFARHFGATPSAVRARAYDKAPAPAGPSQSCADRRAVRDPAPHFRELKRERRRVTAGVVPTSRPGPRSGHAD